MYVTSFSVKTILYNQTGNIWPSNHSTYFLIFCSQFFNSVLDKLCSFHLTRFRARLKNKQTLETHGNTPVLDEGFGNFKTELVNLVDASVSPELEILFPLACIFVSSASFIFSR